ncbi:DNA polymerase beta superfamily protein [Alkalinema pantanalense CENA528]|uniref:nucleotidyltransferase domain-containing protein n=1 Tax=Alkalinema pantanalense TaxID=1620705 RepID=UPI003D6ECD88
MNQNLTGVTLIIPIGTQVVSQVALSNHCLKGTVGVITQVPTDGNHSYRIKLPTGVEVNLKRHEFSIRKQFQSVGIVDQLAHSDLTQYVIYRCITGSRAYGLDDEFSDVDRRGLYLPPADLHWAMYGVPEQLENKANEECYWELQKFLILALKANPNVLECLYSPLVETCTPIAAELLELRSIFLSQLIYQTYNSYVLSQFKKMEQDLRNRGMVRPKHAMHLIRLLLSGITILREGFVPVQVEDHRDALLAIKYQQMSWDAVNAWRLELHGEFDRAFHRTRLPERPDYDRANAFLLRARRSRV